MKDKGLAYTDNRTITVSDSRSIIGSLETWIATDPTYTGWTNIGTASGCTNWNPSPSTITIGQSFVQTATDCKQNQTRVKQDRELETTTNQVRNVGLPINESQIVTVSSTRNSTGTKETWVYHDTVYGSWINSGSVTGCSAWTPAASTVNSGVSFNQTRSCSQEQTRTVQQRERETTIGTIRNLGLATTGSQNITINENQTAYGTKPTTEVFSYVKNNTSFCIRGNNGWGNVYDEIYINGSLIARKYGGTTWANPAQKTFITGGYTYTACGVKRSSYYDPSGDGEDWEECYDVCRKIN